MLGAIHNMVFDSVPVAASWPAGTRIRFWPGSLPARYISSSRNYCGNHTATDSIGGSSHVLLWTNSTSSTHSPMYPLASTSGVFWFWFWDLDKFVYFIIMDIIWSFDFEIIAMHLFYHYLRLWCEWLAISCNAFLLLKGVSTKCLKHGVWIISSSVLCIHYSHLSIQNEQVNVY